MHLLRFIARFTLRADKNRNVIQSTENILIGLLGPSDAPDLSSPLTFCHGRKENLRFADKTVKLPEAKLPQGVWKQINDFKTNPLVIVDEC